MNPTVIIDRKALLLSVILIFLLVLLAGGMSAYIAADTGLQNAFVLVRTAYLINEVYLQEFDWDHVVLEARKNMFDQLDRFSGYMEEENFDWMDKELSGSYGGIGVSVVKHDDGLLIMSVRENSPAADKGLLTGDIMLMADSVALAGVDYDKAAALLRGEKGSAVRLKVFRPTVGDTLDVEITRADIDFVHIPFAGRTSDSMIYIRILDFKAGTSNDLKSALDSLLNLDKKNDPKGLILDLRSNPGGLFDEAFRTAGLFLKKGTFVVGTDGRSRWQDQEYYSKGTDVTDGLPIAIIVDRGSASASEIVAGALKQAGRAVLVGDTTFGKGLVQGFVRFPDGDGLRLTVSRYYFDGGIYLNEFDSTLNDIGHGLVPDYYFNFHNRDHFMQTLENSLILQKFANLHQDEIIGACQQGAFDDSWVEDLALFAESEKFEYTSLARKKIMAMEETVRMEKTSKSIKNSVNRLLQLSVKNDRRQFLFYRDSIKMRLKQIAYERKFGNYQAYRQVVVRENPAIRFATEKLLEINND